MLKFTLHFNVPIKADRKIAINLSSLKYTNNSSEHLISLDTLKIDNNSRITLTKRIRELLRVGPGDTLGFFVDTHHENNLVFRIQRNGSNYPADSWILSKYGENISSYDSDSSLNLRNDQCSQPYAMEESSISTGEQPRKQKNDIKIMIVEDHRDTMLFVENVLCSEGYKLQTFQNSVDALTNLSELMDPFYFDLVIIDIRMPTLNGLQLYQLLRLMNKNLKVVFISALEGIEEMVSILPGLSDNNVLRKPFDSESLIQKVEGLLI